MEVSVNGGIQQRNKGCRFLVQGKSHLEVDDDWGYLYFRKPSYLSDFIAVAQPLPAAKDAFLP